MIKKNGMTKKLDLNSLKDEKEIKQGHKDLNKYLKEKKRLEKKHSKSDVTFGESV